MATTESLMTKEERTLELVFLGLLTVAVHRANPVVSFEDAQQVAQEQADECRRRALTDHPSTGWYLDQLGEEVEALGFTQDDVARMLGDLLSTLEEGVR